MEEMFCIGKIVNTQGIGGDVRVVPTTDDPKRFERLTEVLVEKKGQLTPYKIQKVWYHKQFVIIKFENINNMNDGERLKNTQIKIPKSLGIPLEADEYYWQDLIGLEVYTDEGEFLGVLHEVIPTGANDVYEIKKAGTKDLLIPAIKQCILDINLEEKRMKVFLLEGLR